MFSFYKPTVRNMNFTLQLKKYILNVFLMTYRKDYIRPGPFISDQFGVENGIVLLLSGLFGF